ncbi:ROK family protein [Euzebya tangerina]|uniref:ROK family protein n=1 Tax=Euzebya tangerina TaxID=591198 RepID=UPI000E31D072|nr:ROK family protein [Euzebya tangerina]
MAFAVGVDVGGTKILSGLVDHDGVIHAIDRRPTPHNGDAIVASIVSAVTDLCEDGDCSALPVGVGYPGLVTHDGVARYGPNIRLAEYRLRDHLVEQLGSEEVIVTNDARAATWAEFVIGAGREVATTMVMITLGTGIGGGLIIGGELHRGHNGFAGEVGHVVIDVGGEPGTSGVDGEIEAYASGSAMARMAREAHAAGAFEGTPLAGAAPPGGEAISRAAADGIEPAIRVLAEAGRYLGISAAGLVNVLDPELIVVGGGAAGAGEFVLEPARQALRTHVLGPGHRPDVPIVAATLGPEAGMIGSGLLALGFADARRLGHTSGGVAPG